MLELLFPRILSFIEGTPKQVPTTIAHPTTPLTKGIKTVFPKEVLDFTFFSFLEEF